MNSPHERLRGRPLPRLDIDTLSSSAFLSGAPTALLFYHGGMHDLDGQWNEGLPERSRGVLSDLGSYFLHRPAISTLVEFKTRAEREDYSARIMQRLGISVGQYSVLNIHRIGIQAPVRYVFEELLGRGAETRCWPDHIAFQERVGGEVEQINIVLLGGWKRLLGMGRAILGSNFGTLFRMSAMRVQHQPDPTNFDNARFFLYECSGGYPIGFSGIYIRSPVAEQGEVESAQLFSAVGFDFYGRKDWPKVRLVNRAWEAVHNRVTANVLNRFKQLCELRFEEIRKELEAAIPGDPSS